MEPIRQPELSVIKSCASLNRALHEKPVDRLVVANGRRCTDAHAALVLLAALALPATAEGAAAGET
jgi:hypothetical protein